MTEVEAGDETTGSDQSLAAFLDSWLAFVEPLRSPSTIRGYRDRVRRWKAALGAVKVSKLTAKDLDRTYARWLKEGAAPATVRHAHRVLANALKQGQRWGLITRCVTDLARPPASVRRPLMDLEPVGWQAVVLDLKEREPVTVMAVLLAGVTGARRAELCGLRWSDIDWDRRALTIARSVRHALDKKELEVAPTKTGRVRRLALDERTLRLFDDYRTEAEEWAAAWQSAQFRSSP